MKIKYPNPNEFFDSQSGFTMVETMVAAAIGLIVLMGVTAQITSMITMQSKARAASESMSKEMEIAQVIKLGTSCTASLAGVAYHPSLPHGQPISMPGLTVSGQTITLQDGADLGDGVTLKSIKLIPTQPLPSSKIFSGTFDPATQTTSVADSGYHYEAVIRVQMTRNSQDGQTADSHPTDIPVRLVTNHANVIQSCNQNASDARACAEMGGVYDPNATGANKCTPKSRCDFQGAFSQNTVASGGYVNPFTGTQSCDTAHGYQQVQIGVTTHAEKLGKTGITNVYAADFACMKCGPELGVHASTGTSATDSLDWNADVNSYESIAARNGLGATRVTEATAAVAGLHTAQSNLANANAAYASAYAAWVSQQEAAAAAAAAASPH